MVVNGNMAGWHLLQALGIDPTYVQHVRLDCDADGSAKVTTVSLLSHSQLRKAIEAIRTYTLRCGTWQEQP